MQNNTKYVVVLLLVFLWRVDSFAQIPENIAIHGFGGWAYGRTDTENRYLAGNQDGSYEYLNFSLNISAKPYERLSLHIQPSFNEDPDGNEAGVDYAFAEWSFSDTFNLRIGKVKAPFMLYTEVYDVGTIRPFFFLPQGVYQELAAEAYKGAGITGSFLPGSGWELIYDLYGGKLNLLPKPFVDMDTLQFDSSSPVVNDMLGARLIVRTPFDGFSVGLSSYTGDVEFIADMLDLSDRYIFLATSAEYISGPWWIRSEFLTQLESSKVSIKIVYAEAAYQFGDHWQAAVRYEVADFDIPALEALSPQSLLEHQEIVLGMNYWLNANIVFKFSYHIVEGNRFAIPETPEAYVTAIQQGFQERTHLAVFGAQFSF